MDKAAVIKLRDTLKAGQNIPLTVYLDNAFNMIDEAAIGHFTLWDDKNELLYYFQMINPLNDATMSNKSGRNISVYAFNYEQIQGMEIAVLPLKQLDLVLDSIVKTGRAIGDDMRNYMHHTYEVLLDPNRVSLSADELNKQLGTQYDDRDDYYNGKFAQPFKETARYNPDLYPNLPGEKKS